MADQLGSRLVRSGLVSREDLARAVASATLTGVTVYEALVDSGLYAISGDRSAVLLR